MEISCGHQPIESLYTPDDFIEVAASRGRISEGQTNDLLGINDEDGANLRPLRLTAVA
jgi:hypothetical protein